VKTCFLAMLALFFASSSFAQHPYTEEQVIAYAKSIDVRRLDPSLPSQRLEDWLQSGPPHAHIGYWSMEDTCDLKPGDSDEDYPLCARIGFNRNGEGGFLLVQVGTERTGIVGPPQLYEAIGVFEANSWIVMTGSAGRLSDLPALLDQPAVTDGVQKLYSEIVALHPIGIPTGAEMTAIRPFLSKRLAEQIQTAQACQEDYFGQLHTKGNAMGPAWQKWGIFSGDDKRALPTYSIVDRKEPQKDGSFMVFAFIEYDHTNLGHKPRPASGYPPDQEWRVAAKVVAEDGRYVVDDVRIFDGLSTDGPSHLLSDLFAGCDGSHWIGKAPTKK
jgi:hypothetical protein